LYKPAVIGPSCFSLTCGRRRWMPAILVRHDRDD
jgi:hypothetical protein